MGLFWLRESFYLCARIMCNIWSALKKGRLISTLTALTKFYESNVQVSWLQAPPIFNMQIHVSIRIQRISYMSWRIFAIQEHKASISSPAPGMLQNNETILQPVQRMQAIHRIDRTYRNRIRSSNSSAIELNNDRLDE